MNSMKRMTHMNSEADNRNLLGRQSSPGENVKTQRTTNHGDASHEAHGRMSVFTNHDNSPRLSEQLCISFPRDAEGHIGIGRLDKETIKVEQPPGRHRVGSLAERETVSLGYLILAMYEYGFLDLFLERDRSATLTSCHRHLKERGERSWLRCVPISPRHVFEQRSLMFY